MPSISNDELHYYEGLERAVGALRYFLEDCRCTTFCDHRYMLRRTVNEIAAKIQAHHTQNAVQVLSAPDRQGERKVLATAADAFIRHGKEYP